MSIPQLFSQLLAAIGLSPSKSSSKMPAQAANGSSSNPASPLGQGGVVESNSDDKFLFTSESVGEGHPGEMRGLRNLVNLSDCRWDQGVARISHRNFCVSYKHESRLETTNIVYHTKQRGENVTDSFHLEVHTHVCPTKNTFRIKRDQIILEAA